MVLPTVSPWSRPDPPPRNLPVCTPPQIIDYRWRHPEIRDGEVYMGNTTLTGFRQLPYYSKRLGNVPFNDNGSRFTDPLTDILFHGIYPFFISDEEYDEKHPRY